MKSVFSAASDFACALDLVALALLHRIAQRRLVDGRLRRQRGRPTVVVVVAAGAVAAVAGVAVAGPAAVATGSVGGGGVTTSSGASWNGSGWGQNRRWRRLDSHRWRRRESRRWRRFDDRLGGGGVDLAGHAVARGRHRLQDHREQAVDVDRHRQVLGGCEAAARLGAVARAPEAAGDEEDRRVARLGLAPQVLGQPEAVSVGEHGVDHDRVGRAHGDAAPGPGAFGLGGELVVRLLERVPDAPLQDRVALHDEDVAGHGVEAAY